MQVFAPQQLSMHLLMKVPEGVHELIRLGTLFDKEDGVLALTQEGAHSHRRILHANGDATGYEIVRALAEQVAEHENIEVWDDHYVIDLITEGGECVGALLQRSVVDGCSCKGMRPFCALVEQDNYIDTLPTLR